MDWEDIAFEDSVSTDEYWHLDEVYEMNTAADKIARGKPKNFRMATLKHQEGMLNRYRNSGLL